MSVKQVFENIEDWMFCGGTEFEVECRLQKEMELNPLTALARKFSGLKRA